MGDVDDRHAEALVQTLELVLHLLAQLLVEGAERLVHEDESRVEDERARQRDPLLLPARELRRQPLLEALPADTMATARSTRSAISSRPTPTHLQRKGDVLGDAHMRKQGIVLEHDADVAPVRRHARDRPAVEQDLPRRRGLEPGQHHQGGRLAGAGRPQKGEELARHDVEVEIAHDARHTVEGFVHADELDERRRTAPRVGRAGPRRTGVIGSSSGRHYSIGVGVFATRGASCKIV